MTRREKKRDGPTSWAASMMTSVLLPGPALLFPFLQLLVGVLHHDDGRVDHGAYGDGDAGEAHDVRGDAHVVHEDEAHDDGDGQREDDDEGARQVEEEDEADHAHRDGELDDLVLEGRDGAVDQVGPVVGR